MEVFLHAINHNPICHFLKKDIFTLIGTLDIPEYAWAQLFKIVIPILKYGGVLTSKKN